MDNNIINVQAQLEFIDDTDTAEAAVGLNPYFQWAKIIVTDDQPNLNKQRIPSEEFDNIIRTGVFTPIKMTFSEISKGHKEAFGKVIGTLTQLIKEGNRVIGLAALWKKERPEDIGMLKDMYEKGTPPNVSWEMAFRNNSVDDDGIESLLDTSLTGLTIVSNPAYAGRTSFVAMSSVEDQEETNVEELEQLKEKVTELETNLSTVNDELTQAKAELDELRTYKKTIEDEKLENERFSAIKEKFVSAGITKNDEYFESNREKLLSITDEALTFMIQEIVAFSSNASVNENKNIDAPNFAGEQPKSKKLSPAELGRALRDGKISK